MIDKCTALANSHYPLWNKHGSGQHSSFHFNTITCLQASKFPLVQSCTVLLKLLKKLWLTLIAMAMRIGSLSRILQFDLFSGSRFPSQIFHKYFQNYYKNGLILPTGQWYAPSAVIHFAWYCMVLHSIA